jgi:hypothetical protein
MKNPNSSRFVPQSALDANDTSAQPDLSALIARLLATGDIVDAELALRLEQMGWSALSPAEVRELLARMEGQLGPVAQAQSQTATDAQPAAAPGSEGAPAVQQGGDQPAAGSAPAQTTPQASEQSAQPAQPTDAARPSPAGSIGERLLQAIAQGELPAVTAQPQTVASQPRADAPAALPLGNVILSALARGDMPVVATPSQTQATESGRLAATPGVTPSPAAPTTMPAGSVPGLTTSSMGLPAPAQSSGSSVASPGSTSSSVTSSMSNVSNLGVSADQANAPILTPFVEQRIGQAGSLAARVEISGQTTLQNTGVIGTGTTGRIGSSAIEVPAAPPPQIVEEAKAPPPAPPPVLNGAVSIALAAGQNASVPEGGEGAEEGGGITFLVFTVTRTNGLVGDKIPYTITGIDQEDLASGTLTGGVVDFAPGQTVQELRIAIRRDRTIEADERVTVTLAEGEFSDLIPGRDTADVLVLNDDRFVSIVRAPEQSASVIEGNGDDGVTTVVFRVTRTDGSAAERIPYTIAGIDSADLAEGQLSGNEVAFAAGELVKEIRVVLRRDDAVEQDEFVQVSLQPTARTGVTSGEASARVDVLNDDFFVSVSRAPKQADEVLEGSPIDADDTSFTEVTFVVTRTHADRDDAFSYLISGIDPDDLAEGSLTGNVVEFAEGEFSKQISVFIRKDKAIENDELLTVTLSPSAHVRIREGEDTASVTILNDEGYLLSGLRAALIEGNDPAADPADPQYTTVFVRLTRTAPSNTDGSAFLADPNVPWALTFGSGPGSLSKHEIHPDDLDGVASFAQGEQTILVPIRVLADNDLESDEIFGFAVEPTSRLVVDKNQSISVVVANDDPTIEIVADSRVKSVYEGNPLTFEVKRATGLTYDQPIELKYELVPMTRGETTLPASGAARTGTLTFAPGEASKTITVNTVNDEFYNADQRFYLLIRSEDSAVRISGAAAEGIVLSNDSLVSLSGITPSAELDANGLRTYTVSVSREGPLQFARSLSWEVTGIGENPAQPGEFSYLSGESFKVNFAANESIATVQFKAWPGLIANGERGFEVRLRDTNLPSLDSDDLELGVDAIRGNIVPVGVSATLVAVSTGLAEGSSVASERAHQFRVDLSGPAPIDLEFNWSVTRYDINGVVPAFSADAADFGGTLPSNKVTIARGQTSATFSVTPSFDANVEPNERFYVNLSVDESSDLFAGVSVPRLIGTISNDDTQIGFDGSLFDDAGVQIAPIFADEGSPGGTGVWRIPVVRDGFSRSEVSVGWRLVAVTDGGLDTRASADDFAPGGFPAGELPSGRLVLQPGELKADIEIALVGEADLEKDERFRIELFNPQGGALLNQNALAEGIVRNDDTYLSIASIQPVTEGQGGLGDNNKFVVTFVREGDLRQPARANYVIEATKNASNNADASDLVAGLSKGSVNFAAGVGTTTLEIEIAPDTLEEGNETFAIRLTGTPTARHLLSLDPAKLTQIATINNDDDTVSFQTLTRSVTEDDGSGIRTLTYTLQRTGDWANKDSSIYWKLDFTGLTASADDFLPSTGTTPYSISDTVGGVVQFLKGSQTADLVLRVRNDLVVEANETFRILLSDTDENAATDDPRDRGTRVAADYAPATGTLTNDDVAIVATVTGGPIEGDSGTITYTYTISRVGDTSQQTEITWYLEGIDIVQDGKLLASALDDSSAQAAEFSVTGLLTTPTLNNGWSGDLTWLSGDTTTRTLTVTVNGDTVVEGPEAMALTFADRGVVGSKKTQFDATAGVNLDTASTGADRGLKALVLDNDGRVWVEVDAQSATVSEGKAGDSRQVTFFVYREGDLTSEFTVALTQGGTANGVTGGVASVTFDAYTEVEYLPNDPPRQKIAVSYTLAGDNVFEANETITVTLSNITGVAGDRNVIVDPVTPAQANVQNDDYKITVTADLGNLGESDPSKLLEEGTASGGSGGVVTYTFTRPSGQGAVNLPWRAVGVSDDGKVPVDADDFYYGSGIASMPSGTLSFGAGETSKTVTLKFSPDNDIEPNEHLGILVDASQIGNIDVDFKVVQLTADDAGLSVVARRASVIEGDDPSSKRYVEFDLVAIGTSTTVDWQATAADGNGSVALSSVLANGVASSGQFVFNSADPSTGLKTIRLELLQDSVVGEDITITLGLFSGATLLKSATTKVVEDDAKLTITALDPTVVEGSNDVPSPQALPESYYTPIAFKVVRSGNLGQVTTAPWSILFSGGLDANDFYASGVDPDGSGTDPQSSTYQVIYDDPVLKTNVVGIGGTLTFGDARLLADRTNEDKIVKVAPAGDPLTDQIIQLYIKSDWLKENDELVTVVLGSSNQDVIDTLGQITSGSSIATGSATTTVTNDDAEVQFTTTALVTQVEGDTDTVSFTFNLERTGFLDITSDVTWYVSPKFDAQGNNISNGITQSDFDGNSYNDAGWAAGTVKFLGKVGATPGESSKTITVKVDSDTFERYYIQYWGYPPTQTSKLELDEFFTVTLVNGATQFSMSPFSPDTVMPSIGTSIGQQATAQGKIVNDDVKIQITQIRSNLPEGTAPDANGDVNPGAEGVQHAIQHTVTFERQGDLSKDIWFDWSLTGANFAAQISHVELVDMVTGNELNSERPLRVEDTPADTSGRIFWAAGDTKPKALVISPIGDDTIENDYVFSLRVTNASSDPQTTSHVDEFSYQTGTGSVHNHLPNSGDIELVKFVVKRDEAGVWVSSELVTGYDPETSQPYEPDQQYSGSDYVLSGNPPKWTAGDFRYIDFSGDDDDNAEGSMGVATAGADFTTKSQTLTFTESDRVKTFTVSITNDTSYETREGVGLYLQSGSGMRVADEQGRLTIVDNDGAQGYWLTVNGSTAIEGVDDYAYFTIDLGKALTVANSFDIEIGGVGSRALAYEDGRPGDWGQYFDYSTDSGVTWQSNAPVYEFVYRQGVVSTTEDQVVTAYRFQNGSESGDADTWMEFSDLRQEMGYQVGGRVTEVADDGSFEIWIPVRADAQIDPSALSIKWAGGLATLGSVQFAGVADAVTDNAINQSLIAEMFDRGILSEPEYRIIVGAGGEAFVDENGDGIIGESETTLAFDMSGEGPAIDLFGLDDKSVVIEFEGVPTKPLDLSGFGADDRIEIDRGAFEQLGWDVLDDANQTSKNGFVGFTDAQGTEPVGFGAALLPVQNSSKLMVLRPTSKANPMDTGSPPDMMTGFFPLGALTGENIGERNLGDVISFVDGVSTSPNWRSEDDQLQAIQDYFLDYAGLDSDPNGVKFLKFTAAGVPAAASSADTKAPVITITHIAGDAVAANGNGTFSAIERGSSPTAVNTAPVISGTTDAESGQTVAVVLDGKSYTGTVTAATVSGQPNTWSITLPDAAAIALDHGNTYKVSASVTDAAGNFRTDTGKGLKVDVAAGDVPTVDELYTSSHTPTLTGAARKSDGGSGFVNLATGDTLSVAVNSVTYSLTIGGASTPTGLTYANGLWKLTTTAAIPNGDYQVVVTATSGSSVKTDVSTHELHINDVAPTITLNGISGGVINAFEGKRPLLVEGTTTALVGDTVTVTLGGKNFTAIVQPGAVSQPNTFDLIVPAGAVAALTDGTQTVSATVTNRYGMTASDSEAVVVSTRAPLWHLEGFDAADVVAPQNGDWSELMVVRELTVGAGAGSADASVALDTRALHDESGSLSAAGTYQPTPLRPSFTITSDSIDASGVRTITATITRAAGQPADAVHYELNVDVVARAFQTGSDAREGIVSFEANETSKDLSFVFRATPLQPPELPNVYEQLVIVDQGADGTVGAYIDQDGDGRLSAAEKVEANLAFAEGQDLINLRENRVTVRFDATPTEPLNFQGFGADDRIEINLSALGRQGWLQGNTNQISLDGAIESTTIGTSNYVTTEYAALNLAGRTAGGEDYELQLHSDPVVAGLRLEGRHRVGSGESAPLAPWSPDLDPDFADREAVLADFGGNSLLTGLGGTLSKFVTFVRNDPIDVIVDAGGAYIDLDGDGVLDAAERTPDNQVFHQIGTGASAVLVGQDLLAHEQVTIRFDAVPVKPLILDHLTSDDRILIGPDAEAAWLAVRAKAEADRLASQPVDEWGAFGQRSSGAEVPRGHSIDSLVMTVEEAHPTNTIHVVVDRVLDADGNVIQGAYRDLNRNGRLDGDEAVQGNLAFAADGEDLIGIDAQSVSITFRDAPAVKLDLSGFDVDDRVTIDLDGFAANGWVAGDMMAAPSSVYSAVGGVTGPSGAQTLTGDVFGLYGPTALGDERSLVFIQAVNAIDPDGPVRLDVRGDRADGENVQIQLAQFGKGRDELGLFGPEGRVEFASIKDEVNIVVDGGWAYIDRDADGVLDNNEATADNLAFDEQGRDLIGLDAVSAVITFRDAPHVPLDFSGFGLDDRIEFDRIALAANGWGGADVDITSTIGDGFNSLSANGNSAESGFWFAGNGVSALFAGAWQEAQTVYRELAHMGDDYVALNGPKIALQASLVRGEVARVVVDEHGGWLDLNGDGVLSFQERTDEYQVFDFDVAAGASNRVGLDLASTKTIIRFNAVPDQAIDLSGFGVDDRIEIDQMAFFARGWDLALGQVDPDLGVQEPIRGSRIAAGGSAAFLVSTEGEFAVERNAGAGQDVLQLASQNDEGGARLANMGQTPVLAAGSGRLPMQIDFVQSTVYIVVTEAGAFFDLDADGLLSEGEFVWAVETGHAPFDAAGRDTRDLLQKSQVVIEFNDVPQVPIDLSGFGEDDRIRIDAAAFLANGFAPGLQPTATTSFAYATTDQGSALLEQYASGQNSRLAFGVGARFADTSKVDTSTATPAVARNQLFIRTSALALDIDNEVQIADLGDNMLIYEQFNLLVDFIRSEVIDGFLPGVEGLSLGQRGSLSGGVSNPDVLKLGPGVSRVEIRAPLRDDEIDEPLESITLTVSDRDDGNAFLVPEAGGSTTVVDDDAPVLTRGEAALYDGILQNHYAMVVFDVNNRDNDRPDVGNNDNPTDTITPESNDIYNSDSLENNVGAGQAFTVKLRFLGDWEVALVSAVMPEGGQGNGLQYSAPPGVTYSDADHNDGPPFRPMPLADRTTETIAGVTYNVFELTVPAGTRQILMRSLVSDSDALSDDEEALLESVTSEITHVDPIVVIRNDWVDESAGQATVEVVAVGGTIGSGGASVTVTTLDGHWVERQFIVSREYASFGSLTLGWAVEGLGGEGQDILIDGNGAGDYVSGYFGQIRTSTVDANDFVLIPGQIAGTGASAGLPTGTVTFADGQKEAVITLRVRTDNTGEADEDFRIVLGQPPAGVELLSNPDAPLTFKAFDSAGYGKIVNDDQVFTLTGLILREDIASRVTGGPNSYGQSTGPGYAIAGQPEGLLAPAGYTLHQFVIHREGENIASASVDWVIELQGKDAAGFEKSGPTDAQAHKAETADFLAHVSGDYSSSYGFTWGSTSGSVITSAAKTVVFAPGQSQAVVTLALRDDLLTEDAEIFRVQLVNPKALPGNDGNPGVSVLRGAADFLIADNDGSKVSVKIDWLDNAADTTANALQSGLGNAKADSAVYEGSSADWVNLGEGKADYGNDDLTSDRRMLLTFTRSVEDLSEASEAFFEVRVQQSNWGGPSAAATQTGLARDTGNVWEGYDYSGSVLWRGTVSFAAGETTAKATIRIPDDNLVEGDQTFTVTLYDHEHIPEVWLTGPYNENASLGDKIGIGAQSQLPDWNTTLRDAVLYTATATVVDDDVRLWLNGFRGPWPWPNNYETSPSLAVDEGTAAYAGSGSDPAHPYGEAAAGSSGDLVLNFARAGLQQGDITINWKIVPQSGTGKAEFSDFNTSFWKAANGSAGTDATKAYVGGSFVLTGDASATGMERTITHTLTGLFVADRDVEDDEAFQIEFSVASVSAGPLSLESVLFTPNWQNESNQSGDADGNQGHNAGQLAGAKTMVVNATLLNDDVKYAIDSPLTVRSGVEGDPGATPVDLTFDVTRTISVTGRMDGFNGASSVSWRIVPVAGKPAVDASDFMTAMSGQLYFNGHWNGMPANPVDSDIKATITVRIRPDTKVEYGEHFMIELYDPSVGFVDPTAATAKGIIINDDTGILVNDFRVIEGDTGNQSVEVTVLRVGDLTPTSDFKWMISNADTSDADFATGSPTDGTMSIDGSVGSKSAPVDGFAVQYHTYTLPTEVKGDVEVEDDESFRIYLTKVSGFEELLVGSSTDIALGDKGTVAGITGPVPDSVDHTVAELLDRTYVLASGAAAGQATGSVVNDDTIFSVKEARLEQLENGGAGYTFVLTRSVATPQPQTVTWSVISEGGRNKATDADFNSGLPTGTETFTGSELEKTITVPAPKGDTSPEADEVFTVVIKDTGFGTGAEGDTFVTTGSGAIGVIKNDDGAVFISDSKPIVQPEGSGALTRNYEFDVVRSGSGSNASVPSTVGWELVLDGGASADDFDGPTSGTINFLGDGVFTVKIAIKPDADTELIEQDFGIRLKNATGPVQIVDAVSNVGPIAKGQIGDDDFALTLAPEAGNGANEGDGRSGASFIVTRTGSSDLAVELNWSLSYPKSVLPDSSGSQSSGSEPVSPVYPASAADFVATSGKVVMPANVTSYKFSVPVLGDVIWEENESFDLNLTYRASDGNDVSLTASTVILNDDEGFSVVLAGDTVQGDGQALGVVEGSSSLPGSITLRIIREGDLTGTSAVDWRLTADGTAGRATTEGSATDFATTTLSGRVSFTGNETQFTGDNGQKYAYQDIVIPLAGDSRFEADEGFTVTLSNQSLGSSIRQGVLEGLIYNDDMGYRLALASGTPAAIVEGNEGETLETGIPPGTVTFVVTREADPLSIAKSSRVAWTLSSTGGDAAALQAADVRATGDGVSGSGLSGTVVFAPGETRKEIVVTTVGDDVREGSARMTMTIARSGADSSSTILAATASVQVNDDDDTLSIVASPGAPLSEGNPGPGAEAGIYQFVVSRAGSSFGVANVDWALLDTGASPIGAEDIEAIAIDGIDLASGTLGGTITFADGDLVSRVIEVRIRPDAVGEEDERIQLSLSNESYGSSITNATATQTVTNDDPVVRLVTNNTSALEGNEGADGGFTFRIVRAGDSSGNVSVEWAVVPKTEGATADLADFGGAFPSGVVSFVANGTDEQLVRVLFQGDDIGEADERFELVLRQATGADIGGPAVVDMTLVNDDLAITVEAPSAPEGDLGQQTPMAFKLSVKGPPIADTVSVKWHVEGFSLNPASLDDFAPGQDRQVSGNPFFFGGMPSGISTVKLTNGLGVMTPTVIVAGDNTFGANESFRLVIDEIVALSKAGDPIGGTVVNDDLIATTLDDDLLIAVANQPYEILEGDSGSSTLKFFIDILGDSSLSPGLGDILVDWSVTGDLNTVGPNDLAQTSAQGVALQWDSGTGRWFVPVVVNGDEVIEPNERFTFRLDDAYDPASDGGVEIAEKGNTAEATIRGDDYGIKLTSPALVQLEDRARFEFEILRDGPLDQSMDVRVRFGVPYESSSNSSANANNGVGASDFMPTPGFALVEHQDDPDTLDVDESGTYLEGIVSFASGQTSARFSLEAEHDPFPEADERFVVDATVIAVGNEAVTTPTWQEHSQLTGTIVNDDPGPVQTFNPDMFDPIALPPT